MNESTRKVEVATLTALIVGGVLLFGFTLYVVVAFFAWIVIHPEWLVYAFLCLVIAQSTWLIMAALKKRFDARSGTVGAEPPLPPQPPRSSTKASGDTVSEPTPV